MDKSERITGGPEKVYQDEVKAEKESQMVKLLKPWINPLGDRGYAPTLESGGGTSMFWYFLPLPIFHARAEHVVWNTEIVTANNDERTSR